MIHMNHGKPELSGDSLLFIRLILRVNLLSSRNVYANYHFDFSPDRSYLLLPCVKLCFPPIGLNLKQNSPSNSGFGFQCVQFSTNSNHALNTCFLLMDKSLHTIFMKGLIIRPVLPIPIYQRANTLSCLQAGLLAIRAQLQVRLRTEGVTSMELSLILDIEHTLITLFSLLHC